MSYPRLITAAPFLWEPYRTGFRSKVGLWNLREVAPDIYIGGMASPLYRPGGVPWDTIVDVIGAAQDDPEYRQFRNVYSVYLEDGEPVPFEVFARAVKTVRRAEGPVLIHCAMGISRSVSTAFTVLCDLNPDTDKRDIIRRIVSPDGSAPLKETWKSAEAFIDAKESE